MRLLTLILSFFLLGQSSGTIDLLIKYHRDTLVILENDSKKEEKQEENSIKETDKSLPESQIAYLLSGTRGRLFRGSDDEEIVAGFYSIPGQPPDILS